MLFAAGLGTRLYPITQHKPKALVEVNGISLLERNLRYLQSYGIEEVMVNVHHFSELMITTLENLDLSLDIQISDESDEVLETGGGLVKAQSFFTEDFWVMNVDILTNLNLDTFWDYHQENEGIASLAVTNRESSRKLLFDSDMILSGWKNHKTQESVINPAKENEGLQEWAFSGIHIMKPEIFEHLPQSGKFSIIQPYLEMMNTQKIIGYNHTGDLLIDVGKPEAISWAEEHFE